MLLEKLVTYFNAHPLLALWGPFFVLILCGFGLPLPEDIVLFAAGFLTAINESSIWPPIFITYAGIMLGDSFIFLLGKNFGPKILSSKLGKKLISQKNQDKANKAFQKHGSWVCFFGRFIPGGRTPIFFSAGSLGYKFSNFFFMDGLAALISAPVFVGLGFWAGKKFNQNFAAATELLEKNQSLFLTGIVLFLTLVVLFFIIKNRKKAKNSIS